MQTHALLNVDRKLLAPFFDRVPELFDKYHNREEEKDPGGDRPPHGDNPRKSNWKPSLGSCTNLPRSPNPDRRAQPSKV